MSEAQSLGQNPRLPVQSPLSFLLPFHSDCSLGWKVEDSRQGAGSLKPPLFPGKAEGDLCSEQALEPFGGDLGGKHGSSDSDGPR